MFTEATAAIEQRLQDNWIMTPIDFDNVKFVPVIGTAFIRLQIQWLATAFTSVGGRAKGEGFISISIFVPADEGTDNINGMADTIAGIFNRYQSGTLICKAAAINRIGSQENWYQLQVLIPFEFSECYTN